MTTETILTDDDLKDQKINLGVIAPDEFFNGVARAIEQAILQSPEIQALRKDAEMFQYLLGEAWFQTAFDRFDPDDGGSQRKFESECRRILNNVMENDK